MVGVVRSRVLPKLRGAAILAGHEVETRCRVDGVGALDGDRVTVGFGVALAGRVVGHRQHPA